jgi:hypothetical protein
MLKYRRIGSGAGGGAPTNTVAPAALSGSPIVGQKLYVNDFGTWSNSPTSFIVNWYNENGSLTDGVEQGLSFTTVGQALNVIYDTEVSHTIRAGITAVNGYGSSAEALTPYTSAVTAINLANDAPVITWISGTSDFDVDVAFGSNTFDSGNYYERLQIATDYGFGFLAGQTISSISLDINGSLATVTTAAAHGLSAGPPQQVTVTGATPTGFNASNVQIMSVPTSTTFTYYIQNPIDLVSATASTTGGTLAANTYYYRVSAVVGGLEILCSNELSVTTTGSTSSVTLTWNAYTNATAYKIYRGTSSGGENVYYQPAGTATSYTDTNGSASAGTPLTSASGVGSYTYSTLVYDGTRQIQMGDFASPYNADWSVASPAYTSSNYKTANGTFWMRRQVYAETPAGAIVTSPWSNVTNNAGAGPPVVWNSSDMSPLSGGNGCTLTNNNLTATLTGSGTYGVRATKALDGLKGYFELHVDNTTGNRHLALAASTESFSAYWWDTHTGDLTFTMGIFNDVKLQGTSVGWTSTLGGVATVGIAFDFTGATKKVWMAVNNTWQHSGNPSAGTNYVDVTVLGTGVYPAVQGNGGAAVTAAFASANLTYTPPTGFSAFG